MMSGEWKGAVECNCREDERPFIFMLWLSRFCASVRLNGPSSRCKDKKPFESFLPEI